MPAVLHRPAPVTIEALCPPQQPQMVGGGSRRRRLRTELPAEVVQAAERRAPHRMTVYAHDVAQAFSAFYRDCRVVGAAEEGGDEDFRIALSVVAKRVIARALGAGSARIVLRHVLPTAFPAVIVQATLGMAGAILAEASLSFLGLGVQPPTPSWGTMLDAGRSHLFDAPHLTLFPGLAIATLVLGFNFLGDGLRDRLDPKR